MTKIDFSEWLRKQLSDYRWTQADLAAKSGVSPAQIARVLSGERGLGMQSLSAIAKAMKIPPDEVFIAAGWLPPKPLITAQKERLLFLFDQLPENEKEDMLDYLQTKLAMIEKRKNTKSS
jgi:transcriptional regulator with XRE-family HTH domain